MFKKRIMKKSQRGIYIQDKELVNSLFKVGQHFKYVIDKNNKTIMILPSEVKTNNSVSKRKVQDLEKPVLDIRNKEALNAFENSDYLQLIITEDKIVVEGFENSKENNIEKLENKKIIDIKNFISVKKVKTVEISKNYLVNNFKKIVGGEQLNFYDIIDNSFIEESSYEYSSNIKNALNIAQLPLTICSLFSGAGLMDKAFMDDFDIIFALEMDKDACKTYKHNIGNHIVQTDITKYDKKKIPHATVLIGGPPCQGLSCSNRRTNYLDNPKNLLVKEYIEAVQTSKPFVWVLENVPQILSAGDGHFLKEICEKLKDYEITSTVLDATDFGDAQKRKRAVIIGSKIGKINIFKPIIKVVKNLKQAFEGLTSKTPNQLDYSKPNDLTLKRMSYVPMGGNVFNIPEEIRPKGIHSNSFLRLSWNRPSITIANPRKAMILHPEENRILSVRECARLQGLDDNYIFKGKLSSMQQQVSNGVCLSVFRYISKIIKKIINNFNNKLTETINL